MRTWVRHGTGCPVTLSYAGKHSRPDTSASDRAFQKLTLHACVRRRAIYARIGPEKGIIHLALAAVNNAVWDMFAKSRKKPLWKLIVDMTPVRRLVFLTRMNRIRSRLYILVLDITPRSTSWTRTVGRTCQRGGVSVYH